MPRFLQGEQIPAALIDIGGIEGLQGISEVGGVTSIGALVTMRRLATASLIALRHPALSQAAAAVGAWQTQTVATLGGNICSAATTADTLPALLVADAQLTLVSKSGRRRVGLDEFLQGPGTTALRPTELLRAVELEPIGERSAEGYLKVARRSAMDLAVVGLALRLDVAPSGIVSGIRIAMCGGGQPPRRVPEAESVLLGTQLSDDPGASTEAGAALADAAGAGASVEVKYRRRVLPGLFDRLFRRCSAEISGAAA